MDRRSALRFALAGLFAPTAAYGFGESGVFHPRLLKVGAGGHTLGQREAGLSRWCTELVRRTSAPAKPTVEWVAADSMALFREPFTVWAGEADVGALAGPELRGIERYVRLGGLLVVDDSDPISGSFGRSARRELGRALPEASPIRLDPTHVLFRTFYIIDQPIGRVLGAGYLEAILRGRNTSVLFLSQDLLGALAYDQGSWLFDLTPGGSAQREYAVRFAVNIAMHALCSDYKDDQVHAPWIMRRRARQRP